MDENEAPRYPWEVRVRALQGERLVKVGIQGDRVVTEPPPFGGFSVDPDTADTLSAVYKAAADRARMHRKGGER